MARSAVAAPVAVALLCASATLRADAPPDPVTAIQRDALTSSHAFGFVQSLCDEVGPRLSGSPNDARAVKWALRTMTDLGLANVHAEPVKVTHWERGEARAEMVAPASQPMAVIALGGSVATPAGGVEADVVEAATVADLQKLDDAAVRGKIVFLDTVMQRTRDGSGYGTAVRSRSSGAGEAAKKGAVAMMVRSTGTDHNRLPHTGAKAKDAREIPAVALSAPDAEMLHRVLAEKGTARVRLVVTSRTLPDADGANVVGEVTGRERPDEVVLVGAHLDSWDPGTGAIDDGAGVAIALETARLVAARPVRARRTVRVVLFANEEHGLQGAKGYARAHAADAGKQVAAMEADLGADAVFAVRWRGDPAAKPRFDAIARALAPLGVERQDERGFGGSDVSPLAALGVPVLDLRQDASRYFDFHHSANDTLDKIDPPTLGLAAAAFATAAWTAADMDGDLGRIPEAERNARE